MRILSYNIHRFSQEKLEKVLRFEADMYILPELAHPSMARLPKGYSMEWVGDIDFKGLGVIWKSDKKLHDERTPQTLDCAIFPIEQVYSFLAL